MSNQPENIPAKGGRIWRSLVNIRRQKIVAERSGEKRRMANKLVTHTNWLFSLSLAK